MSQQRFKTEKELLASGWQKSGNSFHKRNVSGISESMIPALGEPFDKAPSNTTNYELPRCKGRWFVSEDMFTEEPLIPIGSKVAIPLSKMPNTAFAGKHDKNGIKQGFFYYTGISDCGRYHKLYYNNLKGGNFYFASEILEAYERYNKENEEAKVLQTPIDYKIGDWILNNNLNNYFTEKTIGRLYSNYWIDETDSSKRTHMWKNITQFCIDKSSIERLATDQEVEDHLLKIARDKYPVGTKFKVAHQPSTIRTVKSHDKHNKLIHRDGKVLHVNFETEEVSDNTTSASVYANGVWAEIVQENKIVQNNDSMKIGDNVKFITKSKSNGIPDFKTGTIPAQYIKHGSTIFKENRGTIIYIHDNLYVVEYVDEKNVKVSLGFTRGVLELVSKEDELEQLKREAQEMLNLSPKCNSSVITYKEDDWVYFETSYNSKGIVKVDKISGTKVGCKLGVHYNNGTFFHENCSNYCTVSDLKRFATNEEIGKALLETANNKGFKTGVEFKSAFPSVGRKETKAINIIFDASYGGNVYSNGAYVYYQNSWGQILYPETKGVVQESKVLINSEISVNQKQTKQGEQINGKVIEKIRKITTIRVGTGFRQESVSSPKRRATIVFVNSVN